MTALEIACRKIGPDHPPFIVAELSGNHAGLQARALMAIYEAKRVGCDAIKFQLFDPERLAARRGGEVCSVPGPWYGKPLVDLYRETQTPRHWFQMLFEMSRVEGLIAFTSVFEVQDIEFLEGLDCPAYKISSFDAGRGDLIRECVKTGKPVIVSNGLPEQDWQGDTYHRMECVSRYPAEATDYPLGRAMYSDHTIDHTLAIAAAACGAYLFEKHFTPDFEIPTPDDHFSIGPAEMAVYVRRCHQVWAMRRRDGHAEPGEGLSVLGRPHL